MIPRVRPSYSFADLRAVLFPTRNARAQFEYALAQHFGMRAAITFPYGRSAIYGVLRAMNLRGEIVQPAYNCVVVAHASVLADGVPVFVDCERDDPNQDANALLDAVNENTAAVIPTSIFGQPFDAATLVEHIRRKNKNAFVLMDCAQAFTTRWNDKLLAAQGDAAILAFGIGKAMTTLFGGAVLTNRADVAEQIRAWQARTFSPPTFAQKLKQLVYFFASWAATTEAGTILADGVERSRAMSSAMLKQLRSREAIRLPATNQTLLTDYQAALGISQLPRLENFLARRREISRVYAQALHSLQGAQLPQWRVGATHTIYTLRLDEPNARTQILNGLRQRGVQGGTVLDYVVPELDCYRERGYANEFRNARAWSQSALNLPNHPSLTDAQVKYCADALQQTLTVIRSAVSIPPLHVNQSIS